MPLNTFHLNSNRLDFETHLKYISLIENLSSGLEISSKLSPNLKASDIGQLKDKLQLVRLTKISIDQECKIVSFDKDYSSSSVLWLPIKSYYMLYHLLCITDCLLTGKLNALSAGHHNSIDTFNTLLRSADIQFNEKLLNSVFDETILNFTSESGEHLRNDAEDSRVYSLVMKKVAKGKVENYKIVQSLSARKLRDKIRIASFKKNMEVSIFDFFHLMRLRMNYRNLDFVDNIPSTYTKMYFEQYYSTTDRFYKCFKAFIDDLIQKCR